MSFILQLWNRIKREIFFMLTSFILQRIQQWIVKPENWLIKVSNFDLLPRNLVCRRGECFSVFSSHTAEKFSLAKWVGDLSKMMSKPESETKNLKPKFLRVLNSSFQPKSANCEYLKEMFENQFCFIAWQKFPRNTVLHRSQVFKFRVIVRILKPWVLHFNLCWGIAMLLIISIPLLMKIDGFVIIIIRNHGC